MSKDLNLPFGVERAEAIADEFGTPVHVYDEAGVRSTAEDLAKAFVWADGYQNYFAVKALPNPTILKLVNSLGMGLDCSSRTELLLAQKLGITGSNLFFTSNNTPAEDFELAVELDATINIDDIAHLPNFVSALGSGHLSRISARYNPGDLKSGNDIIGQPTEAKYGMDIPGLIETFKQLRTLNISEFGLHTMVASNELNPNYFAETADILLQAMEQIEEATGLKFSFVNLGGGMGLNYLPEQDVLDIEQAGQGIREVFEKHSRTELKIYTENGRYISGPNGYLLTRVRYVMQKYKTYLGVDASMHNLMRPGMYGAYHHITVLGREGSEYVYDVSGALCENNDKFAINRNLPETKAGDLIVIHDTGAHGHSMGFNYNGMLRSAEVLMRSDGTNILIRRAETADDYFATAVWPEQIAF